MMSSASASSSSASASASAATATASVASQQQQQQQASADNTSTSLPHELNMAKLLLDLPIILPCELDELLEDNALLLTAAAQCQDLGRLEDSLTYLSKLQENIAILGRHCEIYRSQFNPHALTGAASDAASASTNGASASATAGASSGAAAGANAAPAAKVQLPPVAAHYVTLQKERARAFAAFIDAYVAMVPPVSRA